MGNAPHKDPVLFARFLALGEPSTPAPAQYALIHLAARFCLQLEQAGLPEGGAFLPLGSSFEFQWTERKRRIFVTVRADGSVVWYRGLDDESTFRVGEPVARRAHRRHPGDALGEANHPRCG